MVTNVISPFVEDGKINIDKENWARLKEEYSRDELQDMLTDLIIDGQIDYPMREITHERAIEAQKKLMAFENPPLNGTCFFRNSDEIGHMYFQSGHQLNDASNYYHQVSRMKCGAKNFNSPLENWKDRKVVRHILGGLFTLGHKYVNSASLHNVIQLRTYIASQFKPTNAKGIYDFFKAERVVDPCAGWGDRLSGFFASPYTKSYFGIDPNTNLTEGYQQQIHDYGQLAPEKEAYIVCGCAEDPNIVYPECDLVFTSPPYFESEHYSDDPGQSYLQYSTSELWLKNFLFKVVDKSYAALVQGGHMCINIADVKSKGKTQSICQPMVEYAQSLGFRYEGCMGMRLSLRPNTKVEGKETEDHVYCEQIYTFTKI